jgi:ubiquinone biosynthesis O-methyltransferase
MTNEIKKFFNQMATNRNLKLAENLVVEYEQIVRSQMVVSMLDPKPGEVILDIGCGNARDIIPLSKEGCNCVGIDLSDGMIEEARKELSKNHIVGVELEVGDTTNLRFSDETFDKVFASEVLEHIPNYEKAVSEMVRVLKHGGCLVITTPNRRSWYGFDRYIIYEKLLRSNWGHPYDAWKTFNELASVINENGLDMVGFAGVCYMPGFFISYHLPRIMKRVLVTLVRAMEGRLSKMFPKNGYLLAIKAIKR